MKDLTPQPVRSLKHYSKEAFVKDLLAGLIAAIITLPLARSAKLEEATQMR